MATGTTQTSTGSLQLFLERHVDVWRRELRLTFRSLIKRPGFALIAILSLGFGMGAAITVFSVIDAIDLRPLPFREADRILWLAEVTPRDYSLCSRCDFLTSAATARDWATHLTTMQDVSAVSTGAYSWVHDDIVESLPSAQALPNFFDLLGVQPILGRGFLAADAEPGAAPVIVLSYRFWQTRFGGDHEVLGRTLLTRGGGRSTIIGVLPRDFRFG